MKTIFPRHKPIPKNDKTLTRWQKFAKEKGILKKKSKFIEKLISKIILNIFLIEI